MNSSRTSTPELSTGDVKNYNVMPDLSKTIGDFSGELGPGAAKEWLTTNLERTAQLHSCIHISNRIRSFGRRSKVLVASPTKLSNQVGNNSCRHFTKLVCLQEARQINGRKFRNKTKVHEKTSACISTRK